MRHFARLALCALLAATACRTVPPAVPLAPGDPRPEQLLSALAERARARHALRGEAKLSLDGAAGSARARQRLVVERPDRIRVEVLGFLDQVAALLATDGERYDLYRVEAGTLESGAVHPAILFEVAGIALTPAQAVDVLLGAPDVGGGAIAAGRAWPGGEVEVDLAPAADAGARRLGFGPDGELRRLAVFAPEGELLWTARWDDFERVDGEFFGHELALEFPHAETNAALSFGRVEINPELATSLFRLPPALGAGS